MLLWTLPYLTVLCWRPFIAILDLLGFVSVSGLQHIQLERRVHVDGGDYVCTALRSLHFAAAAEVCIRLRLFSRPARASVLARSTGQHCRVYYQGYRFEGDKFLQVQYKFDVEEEHAKV
jgi:hypothetical protein